MIQISGHTLAKLERMRFLVAVIEREESCEEDIYAEFRSLQEAMVEEFMPVVEKLTRAGLLTVAIDDPGYEYLTKQYDSISGEAITAFNNGNIWIAARSVSGACYRKKEHQVPDSLTPNEQERIGRCKQDEQ